MKNAVKVNKDEIVELIRGERSAVETYRQVFEKYADNSDLDVLREFSADHKEAVRKLIGHASTHGIDTPESSGVWGKWAKLVTGAAKGGGTTMTLKALKEGEEHGLKQYEEMLKKDSLPSQLKESIQTQFIPVQQKHIQIIDKMMSS